MTLCIQTIGIANHRVSKLLSDLAIPATETRSGDQVQFTIETSEPETLAALVSDVVNG